MSWSLSDARQKLCLHRWLEDLFYMSSAPGSSAQDMRLRILQARKWLLLTKLMMPSILI